jgi:hypothetical protein
MAIQEDFAFRPSPAMLDPTALEPMEMTMWEASPLIGLRLVPLLELHPFPMRTSRRPPYPLSSRTARHFFPSTVRVKLTWVTPPLPLPLSSPVTMSSAPRPETRVAEVPARPPVRICDGVSEPPVDEPATVGPATVLPVPGPAAVPPVGAGDCGAAVDGAAVDGEAGLELLPPALDDELKLELGVAGEEVLFVSDFTTAVVLGWLSLAADSRTAIVGLDPPLPPGGAVVVGAGATVTLVVAGATVVGGVVVATVVTGTLLAVPWVPWAPAGADAGAVWAEAGPACRTRNRPARSARDAAHLRGLTTSILGLVLIALTGPPGLAAGARSEHTSQGRGRFTMAPTGTSRTVLAL